MVVVRKDDDDPVDQLQLVGQSSRCCMEKLMCFGWGDHSPRAWVDTRSIVEDLVEVVEHCRFIPGESCGFRAGRSKRALVRSHWEGNGLPFSLPVDLTVQPVCGTGDELLVGLDVARGVNMYCSSPTLKCRFCRFDLCERSRAFEGDQGVRLSLLLECQGARAEWME